MALPDIIAFKKQVNQMIDSGELKSQLDALVYSIKRRMSGEVGSRIRIILGDHESSLRVPSKVDTCPLTMEGIIDESDAKFLIENLKTDSKISILLWLGIQATEIPIDLKQFNNEFVKEFLLHCANIKFDPLFDNQDSKISSVFKDTRLISLVTAAFDNPSEAANTYRHISNNLIPLLYESKDKVSGLVSKPDVIDKADAYTFGAEVNHIKSTMCQISESEYFDNGRSFWLRRDSVLSTIRRDQKTSDSRIFNRANNVLYAIFSMQNPSTIYSDSANRNLIDISELYQKKLTEDLGEMALILRRPASSALLPFGNPATVGGGSALAGRMDVFFAKLKLHCESVELRKEIATLLVKNICEVNSKNLNKKDVSKLIETCCDDVDWKTEIDSLSAKGRANLMSYFKSSQYYREFLNQADLGKILENDLGL